MMFPALAMFAGYMLGKSNVQLPTATGLLTPKQAPQGGAVTGAPNAWDRVCPVDAHAPEDFKQAVRNAWRLGTEEEIRECATQCRAEYPIAAGTLTLRADDLAKRGKEESKVTPIRATSTEPKNGGARVKEEASS